MCGLGLGSRACLSSLLLVRVEPVSLVRPHRARAQRTMGLVPGADLICLFAYFQGLQGQEEEYSPHRKKKEQEIVQKGDGEMRKTAWESGETAAKGNKF